MKRGSITIYLALVFSVLLAMLAVLLVSARDSAIRMKTECSMDAALYSVFAEYNRELLEQYDLLFIDTSYGGGQGSVANPAEHLRYYFQENLKTGSDATSLCRRDLYALTVSGVKITDYALATDGGGAVFERQAVDFIKNKYGLNCMEKLQNLVSSAKDKNLLTRDVAEEQRMNQAQLDSMKLPKRQISKEEWEEVPLDNPADAVNAARSIGILSLVLDEGRELSSSAAALTNYVSHRDCEQGSGVSGREKLSGAEKLLFDRYILEKTDCYTTEEAKGLLKYQLEYILAGKESDAENLKWVANRLLFVRQAANITYLYTDAAKMAEAETLALSITAVILSPEFAEPVKNAILFAWAYAESVYDVKHLMAGGKIPLMKSAGTWHLSLMQMLQFRQYLSGDVHDSDTEDGQSYTDYLAILLLTQNHEKKVGRMMDIIEMDLRLCNGNANFRLDTCMDYLEAEVVVESRYGYSCEITRNYYYY